jgi:chromosome segregation ATPase
MVGTTPTIVKRNKTMAKKTLQFADMQLISELDLRIAKTSDSNANANLVVRMSCSQKEFEEIVSKISEDEVACMAINFASISIVEKSHVGNTGTIIFDSQDADFVSSKGGANVSTKVMEDKLEQLEKDSERDIADLKDKVKSLENENKQLNKDIEEINNDNADLKEKNKLLNKSIEDSQTAKESTDKPEEKSEEKSDNKSEDKKEYTSKVKDNSDEPVSDGKSTTNSSSSKK